MAKKREKSVFAIILIIFLIVLTVGMFSYWAFQSVEYLLSNAFNVELETTIYIFFSGLVGLIGSVIIFIGSLYAWKLNKKAAPFMLGGSIVFLLKNLIDIVINVNPLVKVQEVTATMISGAAWGIAGDVFQIAFWIFVLVFFSRKAFKSNLS